MNACICMADPWSGVVSDSCSLFVLNQSTIINIRRRETKHMHCNHSIKKKRKNSQEPMSRSSRPRLHTTPAVHHPRSISTHATSNCRIVDVFDRKSWQPLAQILAKTGVSVLFQCKRQRSAFFVLLWLLSWWLSYLPCSIATMPERASLTDRLQGSYQSQEQGTSRHS